MLESTIKQNIKQALTNSKTEVISLVTTSIPGIPDLLKLERVKIGRKWYCVASAVEVKQPGQTRAVLQRQVAAEFRKKLAMDTIVMDGVGSIVDDNEHVEARIEF